MICYDYGGVEWRLEGYDPPDRGRFHNDPGEWESITFDGICDENDLMHFFYDLLDPGFMYDFEEHMILALPVDLPARLEDRAKDIDELTSLTPDEFDLY